MIDRDKDIHTIFARGLYSKTYYFTLATVTIHTAEQTGESLF